MGTYYKGQRYGSSTVKIQDTGEDGLYKAMLEGNAVNINNDKLTDALGFIPVNTEYLKLKKSKGLNVTSSTKLKIVVCPSVVQMASKQFFGCSALTDAILPKALGAISIHNTGQQRFFSLCASIKHVVSGCRYLGFREFEDVSTVKTLVYTRLVTLSIISGLSELETLVILTMGTTLDGQNNINANSPIALGTGYIYVPEDDVESCKQRTNWIAFANQIKGINEQVIIPVGSVFTPSYNGSDVVTWDIVKLCSWDCATLNSSTGEITVIDEGYLLVRGLDTNGIPIYVAYINSLEVEE